MKQKQIVQFGLTTGGITSFSVRQAKLAGLIASLVLMPEEYAVYINRSFKKGFSIQSFKRVVCPAADCFSLYLKQVYELNQIAEIHCVVAGSTKLEPIVVKIANSLGVKADFFCDLTKNDSQSTNRNNDLNAQCAWLKREGEFMTTTIE